MNELLKVRQDIEQLAELFYDWCGYASEHQQEKYGLAKDIVTVEKILSKYEEKK